MAYVCMYSDLALRKFADLNMGAEWERGNMIKESSKGVGLHPGTAPRIPRLLSAGQNYKYNLQFSGVV